MLGDLVMCVWKTSACVGIVVERDHHEEFMVPPALTVLWATGNIQKEWESDLEVVNECR